jgi:hypothetical protein
MILSCVLASSPTVMAGVPMSGEAVVSDIDLQAKTWKIPSAG